MSDVVMNLMLGQVVIRGAAKELRAATYDQFAAIGAKSMKAYFFSIRPKDGKTKYDTPDGKEHSTFRNGLLLATLRALQIDTLDLFNNPNSQDICSPDVEKSAQSVDKSSNRSDQFPCTAETTASNFSTPRLHRSPSNRCSEAYERKAWGEGAGLLQEGEAR